MDLKKLPFLPLNYFFVLFEKFQKGLFLLLFTCLLGAGLWTLAGAYWPEFFALEVVEVAEPEVEKVLLQEVEHNYRSFDFSLNAYRSWVNFSAGPILPKAGVVYVFILLQILGWSVMLATASEIQSRWAYLFYLLYAIFLFSADLLNYLIPEASLMNAVGNVDFLARTLKFLFTLPPIILALCFQLNILKWNSPWRFLLFLAWNLMLFSLPFFEGNWIALHEVATDGYAYSVALSLLFLFFIGKEPTKILFAAATNRPQKSARLDYRLILGFCIVLLVIEILWLFEYVNFGFLSDFQLGFRPIYLVVIASVLMVFTSQNHYHQVKDMFQSQANFTFILLSWALIVLSFFAYQYSLGDPLINFTLERAAVIFFLSMGILHTIFVFANHLPLLKGRVNLYYLMANGRGRLEYWIIWTAGLVSIISAGGFENWKSWDLFQHTYYNQAGDQALINGDAEKAQLAYDIARGNSGVSPKANYNLASLLLANPYKVGDAVRYYQDATRLIEFPYARINAASLLALNNQKEDARNLLEAAREPSPLVENNLALIYLKENEVDSAIVHLKKALLEDPSQASIYSNLSMLYMDQGLLNEAQEFMLAGNESGGSQASRTNQNFLHLKFPNLYFEPLKPRDEDDLFFRYNHILSGLQTSLDSFQTEEIKALLNESEMQSPDILLLDGLRLFYQDSIKYAMTRMDFINSAYPAYASDANYLLALGFYQKDVPEMALRYFKSSGDTGNPKASLHAAQMEIELGRADSADAHLSLLIAKQEDLYEEISKERAMLLLPYVKNEVFVSKMVDLESLSFDDNILIGIYADSLNQYITALDAFRKAIELDSSSTAPYLELGKIYNKYQDTLAITNLKFGLSETGKSEDIDLQLELARAYLKQDKLAQAEELFQKIAPNIVLGSEKLRFSAELALAKKDTVKAIEHYASLHQQYPLHQEAILQMCKIFRAQNKNEANEAGNALITQALESNTENAEFWYYYAVFSKAWNLADDAGYGALKAIELTYLSQRKKEIEREFSQEIRTLSSE